MGTTTLLIVSGLELLACLGLSYYFVVYRTGGAVRSNLLGLKKEVVEREALLQEFEGLLQGLVSSEELVGKVRELVSVTSALKIESGRSVIIKSELETVDARFRELEEIERELEAANLEAKEELKILQKKERGIAEQNESLKQRIQIALEEMERTFSKIEMTSQMQEQIARMKSELLSVQSKIDLLLLQLTESNEQYFVYKRRYDALDIEYAQLYEKFSAGG